MRAPEFSHDAVGLAARKENVGVAPITFEEFEDVGSLRIVAYAHLSRYLDRGSNIGVCIGAQQTEPKRHCRKGQTSHLAVMF